MYMSVAAVSPASSLSHPLRRIANQPVAVSTQRLSLFSGCERRAADLNHSDKTVLNVKVDTPEHLTDLLMFAFGLLDRQRD